MSDNPTKNYYGLAWVVRYWWTNPDGWASDEQTAHFLDANYNHDPELSYQAAAAYAARPSLAGRPLRAIEIQRTRFGVEDNRE